MLGCAKGNIGEAYVMVSSDFPSMRRSHRTAIFGALLAIAREDPARTLDGEPAA